MMQDLIRDMADDARSGKNEIYFDYHLHGNDNGCQGYFEMIE